MNAQLAHCIEQLGNGDLPAALLDYLRTLVNFDSAVIMAYPEAGQLQVVHNALHPGDQSGFGGAYTAGLWLLSPLYLNAKAGVRGFFHIQEIAPDNFRQSEYYALYYSSNGIIDQLGYLVESGDGTPLAISLERTAALPPFSATEREALKAAAEVVAALVRKHWAGEFTPGEATQPELHTQVQQVLAQFGSSVLTPREREVAQLLLRGFPSKRAAATLGISAQTEQVHRKNIYNKLGLSSHNELFSLFFDSLVQPCPPDTDPLIQLLPHLRD